MNGIKKLSNYDSSLTSGVRDLIRTRMNGNKCDLHYGPSVDE